MPTLYEVIFEGIKLKKCDDCVHCDACYEYSHVAEMDAEKCDLYEQEGKTLYEELFGGEG